MKKCHGQIFLHLTSLPFSPDVNKIGFLWTFSQLPQGMASVLGDMLTSISDLLPKPDAGMQLNFDINGVGSLAYATANKNISSSEFKYVSM